MRREEDPRINRAEDKHTHFQEEVMQAKKAIDKRAAKAARTRRGGNIAPENQNSEVAVPQTEAAVGYIMDAKHQDIDYDKKNGYAPVSGPDPKEQT